MSEPNEPMVLTNSESGTYRTEDPRPYMTFEAGRVRYFVSLEAESITGPREDVELDRDAYRDLLATLALDARNELIDLLGDIDIKRFCRWIDRMTEGE